MTTHRRVIYHCQSCGAIKRIEIGQQQPECCGILMTNAAADTIEIDDASHSPSTVSDEIVLQGQVLTPSTTPPESSF